jgi:hypothetical protein
MEKIPKKGTTNLFISLLFFFVGPGIRDGKKPGSGKHPGSATLISLLVIFLETVN